MINLLEERGMGYECSLLNFSLSGTEVHIYLYGDIEVPW